MWDDGEAFVLWATPLGGSPYERLEEWIKLRCPEITHVATGLDWLAWEPKHTWHTQPGEGLRINHDGTTETYQTVQGWWKSWESLPKWFKDFARVRRAELGWAA